MILSNRDKQGRFVKGHILGKRFIKGHKLSKIVWTPDKLEFLKKSYKILSQKELAKQLEVTRIAVGHKSNRLGLLKRNPHRTKKIKRCIICNKEFESRPKQRYCSQECWKKEPFKKTTFRKGQIPFNKGKPLSEYHRESLRTFHKGVPWNKRLNPPKEILLKLYEDEKNSLQDIADKFNTSICVVVRWFKEYNIKKRKSISGARGIKCNDGDIAHSSGERIIDNILSKCNIPHIIHFRYLNEKKSKISDWKIDENTYIEYKGFVKNENYFKKFKEKLNWLANILTKKIGLIQLYIVIPNKYGYLSRKSALKQLSPLIKRFEIP